MTYNYLKAGVEKYKYQLLLLLLCIIGYFEISLFILIPKWDNINAFLPYRHIVGSWIAHGHLPLWNPYQLLGYPMHSDPQSAAWYPITWILSLINDYDFHSIAIELCLHYFIGGLGMFLLGRTLKLKDQVAFIMGMSYMFSGFMVGTSQILVMIIAAAWLPFSINYLLKALKEPSFKHIFILAVIQFLSLSGSYPAFSIILLYFYLFIASYYLYKCFKGTYSFKNLLIVFSSFGALVLLLSGAYLLSIYEALPYMTRAEAIPYSDVLFANVAFTFQSFISFFLPYAVTANTEFFQTDASMSNAYFGIFVFIFMLGGVLFTKDKRVRIAFFTAVFFLLISLGMQSPIHYLFYKLLPGFNLFRHPSIFRVYAIFFFIISAAFSIQFYLDTEKRQKDIKRMLKFSLFFFALILFIAAIKTNYTLVDDYWRALIALSENSPLNLSGHILVQAVIQLILIVTAYYLVKKGKLDSRKLISLVFIDLFLAVQLNAPRTIYYSVLFKDANKFYNSMPKGISNQDLDDLMININNKSVLPKQRALYANLNSYAKRTAYDGYNPFKFRGFMDLKESGLRESILHNPLFYIANEAKELNTEDPDTSISAQAYLDTGLLSKYENKLAKGRLSDLEIKYNGFAVNSNLTTGGLIFLNQNFNTNWKAYIGESLLPIYKANVCLMAIDVPAGAHRIEMEYSSEKVTIAFLISLLTFISGCFFLLYRAYGRQAGEA